MIAIRPWLIGLAVVAHVAIIVGYYFYAPNLEGDPKAWWTWYYYHAEKGMTVFALLVACLAGRLKPIETDILLFSFTCNLLMFAYFTLCALMPKHVVMNSTTVACIFLISFTFFFGRALYLKHLHHDTTD